MNVEIASLVLLLWAYGCVGGGDGHGSLPCQSPRNHCPWLPLRLGRLRPSLAHGNNIDDGKNLSLAASLPQAVCKCFKSPAIVLRTQLSLSAVLVFLPAFPPCLQMCGWRCQ